MFQFLLEKYRDTKSQYGDTITKILFISFAVFVSLGMFQTKTDAFSISLPNFPSLSDAASIARRAATQFMSKGFYSIISDFLDDMVSGMLGSTGVFFKLPNIFALADVAENFNDMKDIANVFLTLAIGITLIGTYKTTDLQAAARFKYLFYDVFTAIILLNTARYLIPKAIDGSNLFVDLWLTNISGVNPVKFFVLGITTGFDTLGGGYMIILLLIVFMLIVLGLTHIIIQGFLMIWITVLPLILAAYPTDTGKKFVFKWFMVFLMLLWVGPLQSLAVHYTITSMLTGELNWANMMTSLGMLIVTVFLIPSVLLLVFTMAQNPKTFEA